MLIFVYHNNFKLYCILWASYLFIQGKESELQEIENILQGTNIKELLKNYKENHPEEKKGFVK